MPSENFSRSAISLSRSLTARARTHATGTDLIANNCMTRHSRRRDATNSLGLRDEVYLMGISGAMRMALRGNRAQERHY